MFDFLGDFFSGVGEFFSGVTDFLSDGLSMIVEGLSGIGQIIGEGIKSLCEAVGSQGLALIGCIAMSILVPGFGIAEILTIIQCIAQVAKLLGVNNGDDSPEELGMKAEISDKKPEDFDSTEEYIKHLNDNVELDKDAVENLTDEEKAKYGAMGAALNIKAIQEKYGVSFSSEFWKGVSDMKMNAEEVASYIETCRDKGITNMQDMTDYLRDKPIDTDRTLVGDSIIEALRSVYPELSNDQLEVKLLEMRDSLQSE